MNAESSVLQEEVSTKALQNMEPNTVEKRLLESTPDATAYSYTLLSDRKKRRDRYFIELRIVHEIELISEVPARSSFQNRENIPQIAFV